MLTNVHGGDLVGMSHQWRYVEPPINLLQRDGWRKRTERFTHFDHGIDALAHVGNAWVREDTAVAQRARTIFHAATEFGDGLTDRVARIGRSEQRGGEANVADLARHRCAVECCTQSGPVI